jgi:hypothetical protein
MHAPETNAIVVTSSGFSPMTSIAGLIGPVETAVAYVIAGMQRGQAVTATRCTAQGRWLGECDDSLESLTQR